VPKIRGAKDRAIGSTLIGDQSETRYLVSDIPIIKNKEQEIENELTRISPINADKGPI
jgi:hypothetical protein